VDASSSDPQKSEYRTATRSRLVRAGRGGKARWWLCPYSRAKVVDEPLCRLHIYSQAIASSPPSAARPDPAGRRPRMSPRVPPNALPAHQAPPRESAYDAYAALVARLRSVMPVESPIEPEELLAGHVVEAFVHTLNLPVGGGRRGRSAARAEGLEGEGRPSRAAPHPAQNFPSGRTSPSAPCTPLRAVPRCGRVARE
jgi:hypothetical protein